MGIEEKDMKHIFERFYRADRSRSQIEGFGLGLSIAKSIATAHHGSITVKNNKTKGSSFIVHLPLKHS
jgi:signal transduction histidine kinase